MKEAGILFSAPMVKALLRGQKTMTRRLSTSPVAGLQPGDRLYVREAWATMHKFDKTKPLLIGQLWKNSIYRNERACPIFYPADCSYAGEWPSEIERSEHEAWAVGRGRPGIHMPKWASRILLTVKEVRIEPLQDISEDDAIAEGVEWLKAPGFKNIGGWRDYRGLEHDTVRRYYADPRMSFATLWASLHTGDDDRWDANPMVAAISFGATMRSLDWRIG